MSMSVYVTWCVLHTFMLDNFRVHCTHALLITDNYYFIGDDTWTLRGAEGHKDFLSDFQ